MVHLGNPLWHTVVVGVFSFEKELMKTSSENAVDSANAAIGAQVGKVRITLSDQPHPRRLVDFY